MPCCRVHYRVEVIVITYFTLGQIASCLCHYAFVQKYLFH